MAIYLYEVRTWAEGEGGSFTNSREARCLIKKVLATSNEEAERQEALEFWKSIDEPYTVDEAEIIHRSYALGERWIRHFAQQMYFPEQQAEIEEEIRRQREAGTLDNTPYFLP